MLWYGKALGVVLGIAAGFGVAGALIGGLTGHMVDEIIDGRLAIRRMRKMSWGEGKESLRKALIALYLVMENLLSPLKHIAPSRSFLINAVSSLFIIPHNERGVLESFMEDYSRGKNRIFDSTTLMEKVKSEFGDTNNENSRQDFSSKNGESEQEKVLLLYAMGSEFLGENQTVREEGLKKLAGLFGIPHDATQEGDYYGQSFPRDTLKAYRIFGLNPPTTKSELKKAYRSLAVQFHPDGAKELSEEQQKTLEESFKKIQGSYEILRREVEGI